MPYKIVNRFNIRQIIPLIFLITAIQPVIAQENSDARPQGKQDKLPDIHFSNQLKLL